MLEAFPSSGIGQYTRLLTRPHPPSAGTSRSIAVIVATIMKAKRMSAADALSIVSARCPAAAPNTGFLRQLHLWEEMGWQLDEDHPAYKRFLMQQVNGVKP